MVFISRGRGRGANRGRGRGVGEVAFESRGPNVDREARQVVTLSVSQVSFSYISFPTQNLVSSDLEVLVGCHLVLFTFNHLDYFV